MLTNKIKKASTQKTGKNKENYYKISMTSLLRIKIGQPQK